LGRRKEERGRGLTVSVNTIGSRVQISGCLQHNLFFFVYQRFDLIFSPLEIWSGGPVFEMAERAEARSFKIVSAFFSSRQAWNRIESKSNRGPDARVDFVRDEAI
jgi:hypothetical protein